MQINKQEKYIKKFYYSVFLALALIFISTGSANINHAKTINEIKAITYDIPIKEFAYSFKIADKLTGTGEIKLSVKNNKIRGIATGIGKTCQCKVDFYTNIEGFLNSSNGDIAIEVDGTGDPLGIPLPGKVSFQGPLKGFLDNEKLSLVGKVNIQGCLARYAGFNNTENIIIEIPDSTLAKAFKQIQDRANLASL